MADSNRMIFDQQSDGTGIDEVGVPSYSIPVLHTQNQMDTMRVEDIEIVFEAPATDVLYRTGGLPLALTNPGGVEITPDADTPLEHYKFSAMFAEQMRMLLTESDVAKIVSVDAVGQILVGGEIHWPRYDATKDKVRLYSGVDGLEATAGQVITDEDAAKVLRLRVTFL